MGTAAKLDVLPTLKDLLADPRKINGLPREAIPYLRGELAQLDTLLLSRLLSAGQSHTESEDRLLQVSEAAARLSVSVHYLYRNSAKLPFTRHLGRKLVFSSNGIDKYIRSR